MASSIGLVFVNYRDYESLDSLLSRNIPTIPKLTVVVVDNTEEHLRDASILSRWRSQQNLTVLTTENKGYLGAARHAFDKLDALRECDFFILANSDLSFNFNEITAELSKYSSRSLGSKVGILAPRLVASGGKEVRQLHYQKAPAAQHFRRLRTIFGSYWAAVAHRFLGDLKRKLLREKQAPAVQAGQALFAPHGAMMIFTRAYLTLDEPFSHPVFLFCEEIYVGLRAEQAGLSCLYAPRITYTHQNHGSMGRIQSRRVIGYLHDAHAWATDALTQRESNLKTGTNESSNIIER